MQFLPLALTTHGYLTAMSFYRSSLLVVAADKVEATMLAGGLLSSLRNLQG